MTDQEVSQEVRQTLRVLDANINRAAEGLRTIEDFARLVAEDAVAAEWMKSVRHRLAALAAKVNRPERLSARSTLQDAGTQVTSQAEKSRQNLAEIVPAAAERVGQALRCLEEYSKLLSASLAEEFKQLRYEAYDVLAQAELRLRRPAAIQSARLYLLIDCHMPLDRFVVYVLELASAGVELFQLRDKQAEGNQLLQYARATVHALASTGARLIINDRVDIAIASGAAGVHLGQDDLPLADARRLAGSQLCIGISTHDLAQAVAAQQGGADYIGCGPTFPSKTKNFDQFAGPEFLRAVAADISVPAFAIGGIDCGNIPRVLETGISRVAVSGVIHSAANPAVAARELRELLG